MREIKFRGKAKMSIEELDDLYLEHENWWVYGHLVMYGKTPYIVGDFIEVDSEYTVNEFWVPVYPESVGQFTGLTDKNGKEIYEGDIVRIKGHALQRDKSGIGIDIDGNYVVKWSEKMELILSVSLEDDDGWLLNRNVHYTEVIGNIFQDGDLLRDS